jgi:glucose-6-phosphate 1-dehydrogenase
MEQCTFVIMGATGDLSTRKLIPGIYHLLKDNKVKKVAIVGAAITKTDIKSILNKAKKFIKNIDTKAWKKLENSSYYKVLDFYDPNDYKTLRQFIKKVEKKHNLPGNRVFYLAALPQHFEVITKQLAKNKITQTTKKTWSRIVFEKPFGTDLKSSKKINKNITKIFDESQIYRIDHYLWYELVSNIELLRFTNIFFEPIWNKKYIESVEIILDEKLGVEGRGKFYDTYGALKDVVQNHMFQILSLIAMEPPKTLTSESIRNEKAKLLKKVKYHDALLGQFKGYRKTKGVDPKSKMETFAALKLSINNSRWRGVPFFLKTGKCLSKKETSIKIVFKRPPCLQKVCTFKNNVLSIQINPQDGFFLELNTKEPGKFRETTTIKMDFCHPCKFGPNTPQVYESLLSDIIAGNQAAFVRFDEIEYSWKLIEKILKKQHVIHSYNVGSEGPRALKEFWRKK